MSNTMPTRFELIESMWVAAIAEWGQSIDYNYSLSNVRGYWLYLRSTVCLLFGLHIPKQYGNNSQDLPVVFYNWNEYYDSYLGTSYTADAVVTSYDWWDFRLYYEYFDWGS